MIYLYLSQREREGPIAKQWEGEGLRSFNDSRLAPSSSHALRHGPLLLPMGEGKFP